ncbi:hypothetical protein ACFYRN_43745 [Streptomyces sp. NPDC005227]|uniref:hypothetical protein n=1 Tax=Streptomyces sp. NPDC005227 TaxID=3364707 RepID=UPI003699694F
MGFGAFEGTLNAAHADPILTEAMSARWPECLREVAFGPSPGFTPWEDGLALLHTSVMPVPDRLVPLALVDDQSLACAVLWSAPADGTSAGTVVRWHLGKIPAQEQGRTLDVDPLLYLASLAQELTARESGFRLMTDKIFPDYEAKYVSQGRMPRAFVTRPVRLACQNVVAGLAAFAHDSTFDGLSVAAWQTCELPHVATHEANRAMTALLLCEAFQSGGTMEIRFDRSDYGPHPEGRVPAALVRYARSVGVVVGGDDGAQAWISPTEARKLFLAVTPMPLELHERVLRAAQLGHSSPERMCYTLMSQTWREIELDFMLAVSARAHSVLTGGADVTDRGARQAESDVARAALILGMLHRRLDSKDAAVGDGAGLRVLEDNRHGVTWRVNPQAAAVEFQGLPELPLPWLVQSIPLAARDGRLTVLPRTLISHETLDHARQFQTAGHSVLVVLPADADPTFLQEEGIAAAACPDRLGEIDLGIESRLTRARVARA